MQISMIVFFVLFAALGLYIALRGERNAELWLVVPPVLIAIALAAWRAMSGDEAVALVLSVMLLVFAACAAGAIIGLGIGRMLSARRAAG